MKKILLSCVTCLLALGLVTACDDEVEDVTPEDPNAGVVEPGGDEGGGTSGGGSGDTSTGSGHYVGKEVSEYVSGESYLLGMVTADGKTHYGTGVMSGYYGATTTDYEAANSYTITDVDGGVTLSTVVEGKTVYVTMAASDGHYNLVYSETAQVLTYDSEYNTFTITTQVEVTDANGDPAVDEETQDPVYEDYTLFLGTYGDYSTLGWYNYAWISQSGEYPAHLYELVELSNPTSISVTGEETSVEEGKTIQLTASVTPADAYSEVVWSTSDEKVASVNESGLVTGVAVGNATITATSVTASAVSGSIVITVTEVAPLPEGMIGYFDFTGCTATGTAISASTDLDTYWVSDMEGIYLGARQYNVVYLGGGGSEGAYPSDETECIKFGTSSANGSLQLKFAVGTSITQVVLTASGWNNGTVISSATLTLNGQSQDCSTSGELGELTYDITEDWTYLLTFEATNRLTIHSISIYGSYNPDNVPYTDEITITPETVETLNVGESDAFTVSWDEGEVFDIDTLTWTSSESTIVSVEQTTSGATAHALAAGSATISASDGTVTSNSVELNVEDILEESETFVASQLGYGNAESVPQIDGHQVKIVFSTGTNNQNDPKYYDSGTAIRCYSGNTVTFTGTYETAPIASVVITYPSGNAGTITVTNGTYTQNTGAYTYTLVPSQGATGDMVMTYSANGRISQITVNYTLAA